MSGRDSAEDNNVRRLTLSAVLAAQILLIGSGSLSPSASSQLALGSPTGGDGWHVARVYVEDRRHLDAIAGELDIWEVYPEEGYVVAALTSRQEAWLRDLGYPVAPEAERTGAITGPPALDARYYYFDDQNSNAEGRHVVDLLQAINDRYPDLTELVDVGDAWMAGQPGEPHRDIWVLRVTNEDPAYGEIADKPPFFLSAAMHAREVATTELAIRYVKHLTDGYDGAGGYGVDPDVTWLVDRHVAYVLVMHNPDGHVENERDVSSYRRKNMDWDDGCAYSQYWGVDLNRNHSFLWGCCGGSSGNPCAETYRGPGRASEPETQAFESFFTTVMEDQNGPNGQDEIAPAAPITTTGIFISLHSYADMVLWPWAFDDYDRAPNHEGLRTIGRKLAAYNGYQAGETIGYDVDGATDDWAYGTLGIPSFTFEVGPEAGACAGFFPPYDCIDGHAGRDFWAENRPAFLYAHRIAGSPYRTAYGPDVEDVTVSQTGHLTATLTDRRYSSGAKRAIAAAEYIVVDDPADVPGEPGTGTPLSPTDGSWGDLNEEAVVLLDSAEFAFERHLILVRAQNDEGVWGPFSAAFGLAGQRVYLPLVGYVTAGRTR
jgi:hypothetical protein